MERLLTENEVINYLITWLELEGWSIKKTASGYQHGNDIEAERNGEKLIIEAKGAKANDNAKTKKRDYFNTTQIKVHFGEALVKIMEEQTKNSTASFAIAQPDTKTIRETLKNCLPQVHKLGIDLFWVESNGNIVLENNTERIT